MNLYQSTSRVTIMDVARAAQVSRQTVSNVVNRPERVREDTRTRVQAEIDRLGYRPSIAAQSLRAQRAGAVGIELNTLGEHNLNDVVYPFLVALAIAAPHHRCHMVPFGSSGDQVMVAGYENMTRAHLVDAFILADTHAGDPRPAFLLDAGVPFATFGRVWDDPDFSAWADVDGAEGTGSAVTHLAEAGYERIGFLGWPTGSESGDLRRAGWSRALAETGLAGAEFTGESVQNPVAAFEVAQPLVKALGTGGALVCASDVLAFAATRAAERQGLTLGRDFGVVGFDDSGSARLHEISSVAQPLTEIADYLLGLVGSQLASGQIPTTGRLFKPRLMVRSSSTRS